MAHLHNDNPFSKLLFGGFPGITEEGIPHAIKEKYDQAVSQLMWTTYDGLWSAAASGIAKGAAFTAATIVLVSGLAYGLVGAPSTAAFVSGAGSATLTEGVAAGLGAAFGALLTPSIGFPILAAGAAIGALYDVGKRQNYVQKELAETRTMMRNYISMAADAGVQKQPSAPEPERYEVTEKPSHYWQERMAQHAQMAQNAERSV